jgi:hypothetical protein
MAYQYDVLGNLTGIARKDSDGKIYHTKMDINADNQLTKMRITGRDEMKVAYTGRGEPKLIEMGERQSRYFYDKAGRLIKVIDTDQGELTYQYGQDELDIRVQLDTRTAPVDTLTHSVNHHNQNLDHLYYTRGRGNPWQAVVFSEKQSKLLLPNPVAFNQPDKSLLSSIQRRRLFNAKATEKAGQIDFDKASNAAWLPPQYSAMNCIIYDGPCTINDVSIGGPLVTTVGENNLFFAIPLDNTYDCTPAYKYFVNGVYAGSWSSGLFNYTFNSSGYHTVEVRAYCDCSWFQQIHAGDFISVFGAASG